MHIRKQEFGEEIRTAIKNAQLGSDIYGVLEKVAYKVNLENSNSKSVSNWYEAQLRFTRWAITQIPYMFTKSFESYLRGWLQHQAYGYRHSGGTSFDHWMKAQYDYADEVIDFF